MTAATRMAGDTLFVSVRRYTTCPESSRAATGEGALLMPKSWAQSSLHEERPVPAHTSRTSSPRRTVHCAPVGLA